MRTEGSVFEKQFADCSEGMRKLMKKVGEDLMPEMKEADFISLSKEIQRLHRKPPKRQENGYRELNDMGKKKKVALRDFMTLNRLLLNKKDKESSLIMVPMFLFLFEGVYAVTVNDFCLRLVMRGHDLFDPIRREYASSSIEIGDVDITTKFRFLERHNLKMLVRREDQRLRNRIAHYDFGLDNEGNFSIDGRIVNLGLKLFNLLSFNLCVNWVTSEGLKALLRKR